MNTLQALCEAGILAMWSLPDAQRGRREFYYTHAWITDFNALPDDYRRQSKLSGMLPVRANLAAHINRLVDGTQVTQLGRAYGEDIVPAWKRLPPPCEAVVEFRTWDTRNFGFFSKPNVFVAHRVVLADLIKGDKLAQPYVADTMKLIGACDFTEIERQSDVPDLITD